MTLEECGQEKQQLSRIKGIQVSNVGFICTDGIAFDHREDLILIDGAALYQ